MIIEYHDAPMRIFGGFLLPGPDIAHLHIQLTFTFKSAFHCEDMCFRINVRGA